MDKRKTKVKELKKIKNKVKRNNLSGVSSHNFVPL